MNREGWYARPVPILLVFICILLTVQSDMYFKLKSFFKVPLVNVNPNLNQQYLLLIHSQNTLAISIVASSPSS